MRPKTNILPWVLGLAVMVGCATGPALVPAPAANQVGQAAAAQSSQGVRVVADGGAWRGVPAQLPDLVPVKVSIENRGDRPVLLRFAAFSLVTPAGERLTAIPPLEIEGEAVASGIGGAGLDPWSPLFEHDNFFVAPHARSYYPGIPPWGGIWYPPVRGTGMSAPMVWPLDLPTRSMLEQALPEGVIERGGHVSGFVYFPDVPGGTERIRFEAELLDAETGEAFGRIRIPFIPKNA